MSMSKKDFIALADVIRAKNEPFKRGDFYPHSSQGFFDRELTGTLADFLTAQNPRFNRSRWLAYIAGDCGPSGGAVKAPCRCCEHPRREGSNHRLCEER